MKNITEKCERCGAPIKLGNTSNQNYCEYCGELFRPKIDNIPRNNSRILEYFPETNIEEFSSRKPIKRNKFVEKQYKVRMRLSNFYLEDEEQFDYVEDKEEYLDEVNYSQNEKLYPLKGSALKRFFWSISSYPTKDTVRNRTSELGRWSLKFSLINFIGLVLLTITYIRYPDNENLLGFIFVIIFLAGSLGLLSGLLALFRNNGRTQAFIGTIWSSIFFSIVIYAMLDS